MTSPPPNVNPPPLTIGRTFLKQYYHVLTTTPDMIYKFYRPSSVLSHGEGNNPTSPVTLESLGPSPASNLKDRFFSWAASASDPVRFELEHGAIDAQESVGGGVLLVVTGHLYLGESRKPFCHTFLLNVFSAPDSKKRQYYVHNDVLRFLQEESPPMKESALTAVAEEEEEENVVEEVVGAGSRDGGDGGDTDTKPKLDDKAGISTDDRVDTLDGHGISKDVEEQPLPEEEEQEEKVPEEEVVVDEEQTREPESLVDMVQKQEPQIGDGVEETKEEPIEEDAVVGKPIESAENEGEKANKRERKSRGYRHVRNHGRSQDPPKSTVSSAKTTPGSWASLVASGSTAGATAVMNPASSNSSPSAADNATPPDPVANHEPASDNQISKGNENKPRSQKRDPDCTLVIKNVPEGTKDTEVRSLFEPFAIQTNAKIKGITVSNHRGLAFVDYDSTAPVFAALEQRDQLLLNGRMLDVEQKTVDRNRGRGGSGGRSFRSDSPANGNGYRGGRSGSNQRHRSSGGRSDRGRNTRGGR